ncbi:MAG TPA: trypsin-like peptidase domain-containing protein, partial [Gemmatimonadaceae bacterium]|nr:trypsin-like peptidase domain-containing protein [Gemmatimonadaceae bacterium]
MNRFFRALPALILLAFSAGCGRTPESEAAAAQAVATTKPANVSASRRTAITEAVAHVAPAVVTVQTEILQRVAPDPFDWPFGGGESQQRSAGLGTGFIVRPDGVIVTNAHVVAGATQVSVMMRDGKTFPAKLLGADETNDLAVIKIDATGLPVAKLGNSENLLVGEWAIAIGNPYGFLLGNSEPSVTAGVISGTGRNLVGASEGGGMYVDMVQTDAAINPGNSGGPLLNAAGEVVGVNSSIYSPSGGSIGLGFAIPINRA